MRRRMNDAQKQCAGGLVYGDIVSVTFHWLQEYNTRAVTDYIKPDWHLVDLGLTFPLFMRTH